MHTYCPAHTPVPDLCLPYDLSWHSGVRSIVPSSFAPHLTSISGHRAQPTSWECPSIPSLSRSHPVLGSPVLSPHTQLGSNLMLRPADTTGPQLHLWPGLEAVVGPGGQPHPQTSQTPATRTHRDPRLHLTQCYTPPHPHPARNKPASRTSCPQTGLPPRLAYLWVYSVGPAHHSLLR